MNIVEPHRTLARECTNEDARRIRRDSINMLAFFGRHTVALAHPQVEDKKPLRFFILATYAVIPELTSLIIINPRIVLHSGYTVDSVEGCVTFADRDHITKQRWRLIDVEYQLLNDDGLSPVCTSKLK